MTAMSPVQEKMEQWTGEQEKIREDSEHMCPVFGHEEKSKDSEKGIDNEPSSVIHHDEPHSDRWTIDACSCSYT